MTVCRIGVAKDAIHWHRGFLRGLEARRAGWEGFTVELIDVDRNDWLEIVRPFDVILWKPTLMGEGGAAQFRAKVHFMETVLGKLVVPNVATCWHFDNKAAQRDIFAAEGVPTPATVVAYSLAEAERCLALATLPLVIKQPHGAASDNVFLVSTREEALRAIRRRFGRLRWMEMTAAGTSFATRARTALREGWLLQVLWSRLTKASAWQTMYWQEYIPGNTSDLRVTVIGQDIVLAFRRGNRPGDFRASGSGRLMYDDAPPLEVLKYCLELSRKLDFDSMAYDILFDATGQFLISEMSYGYNDKAVFNTPGHHRRTETGELVYIEGHFWPQDLWGEWTMERARRMWLSRSQPQAAG